MQQKSRETFMALRPLWREAIFTICDNWSASLGAELSVHLSWRWPKTQKLQWYTVALLWCWNFSFRSEKNKEGKDKLGNLDIRFYSRPLSFSECVGSLNKIEYSGFSYGLQLQEVIPSSCSCWSQPHVHPGRAVPWAGCACLFTLSCWCSRKACAWCQTLTAAFLLFPAVHLLELGVKFAKVSPPRWTLNCFLKKAKLQSSQMLCLHFQCLSSSFSVEERAGLPSPAQHLQRGARGGSSALLFCWSTQADKWCPC